ncbi:MAG: PorV/PorQ family protein [Balneolaceae bacterium]
MNKIGKLFLRSLFVLLLIAVGFTDVAEAQRGVFPSLGGSRSGTSGFQFLKINVDARSSGLAASNVADVADGSALYFNPALAVQADQSQVYLAHTAYFTDISLNYASYIHKFNTIALGGSLMYLDSGEMEETDETNPLGTGRIFRTTHLAAGASLSHQLSELFSYGLSAKYIEERIEEVHAQSVVFDIGFFYRVGDTGLRFAIGLNNFGMDATPYGETIRPSYEGDIVEDEFEDTSPPTMFLIGAAYDAYEDDNFKLLLTGQLSNPSDNAERFSVGSELTYIERFMLRVGYEFGVDEAILPSAGVGFVLPVLDNSLGIDYGYSTRNRLGNIHRLAVKFNL